MFDLLVPAKKSNPTAFHGLINTLIPNHLSISKAKGIHITLIAKLFGMYIMLDIHVVNFKKISIKTIIDRIIKFSVKSISFL